MQTFEFPNIMTGSRSNALAFVTNGYSLRGMRTGDGVVGDYKRVTLDADAKDWAYLYMIGVNAVGDVAEGTELTISLFARVNGGPCKLVPTIRRGDGSHLMHELGTTTWEDVGGGWTLCVTRTTRNAVAYDSQILYVSLSLDKAGTTYDVAQPMVCVADEPRAWAPAAGEVWP